MRYHIWTAYTIANIVAFMISYGLGILDGRTVILAVSHLSFGFGAACLVLPRLLDEEEEF